MFEAIGNGILWIIKYIRVNYKLYRRNIDKYHARVARESEGRFHRLHELRKKEMKRQFEKSIQLKNVRKEIRLNEETRKKRAAAKRLVSQIDHAINTGLANKKTKVKYDGEIHTMTELIRILDGTGIVKKGDDK